MNVDWCPQPWPWTYGVVIMFAGAFAGFILSFYDFIKYRNNLDKIKKERIYKRAKITLAKCIGVLVLIIIIVIVTFWNDKTMWILFKLCPKYVHFT